MGNKKNKVYLYFYFHKHTSFYKKKKYTQTY